MCCGESSASTTAGATENPGIMNRTPVEMVPDSTGGEACRLQVSQGDHQWPVLTIANAVIPGIKGA